jgi:murein DD-endopeptidase MepM/ murein hydrolase activator NlpD
MPRNKALFIAVILLACLVLALPAEAVYVPENPISTGVMASRVEQPPAAANISPPKKETTTGGSPAPPSPASLASTITAALPHHALEGRLAQTPSLTALHFGLARPFSEPYRQSPESTYPYGSRGDGRYVLHTGIDISNPLGTPVRAVGAGQVVYAGNDTELAFGPRTGYYGNLVITRLETAPEMQPIYVLFGHLDRILVTQGQQVSTGEVVGLVGMTGIAIGPHLHLEVRQGDSSYQATRNPAVWLSNLPGRGTLAGRIVDEVGRPVAGERLLIYRSTEPGRVWRVARSYLNSPLIQGDDAVGENFVLPDMPAGSYRIVAGRSGGIVQIPVKIEPGRLTLVEIRVQSGP